MRLLYVVAKAEYFISHRLDLANFAKNNGYEVAVSSTIFTEKLKGIKSFEVPFKRGGINVLYELRVLWALFKIIYNYKPALIHNVALKPALYGGFLARVFQIPSVNSINGFGYIFTSKQMKAKILKPLISLFLRIVLNHSKATIIVQNQDDFADCAKLLPKALVKRVPGSGVNTNYFYPNVAKLLKPLTFVLAARMLWSKGVQEYVDAAEKVKQQFPDTRFLLVGDPDLENPESITYGVLKAWNNQGLVEWLGYQIDMKSIYDIAHVAVLPSYREGMPKALLEAMACGLPIITTDTRGCRDLFCENGYLVPVKNTEALVKAMVAFINSSDLHENMAANSLQAVRQFHEVQKINRKIFEIYCLILKP
jgi:glycosyltransferase involved in cell wall biosynthesis